MRIGVISDTHGTFPRRVRTLFAGVDHILHAGDIGSPEILAQCEQLASTTAVCGNTDTAGLAPATAVITLNNTKFLVHHIVTPSLSPQPISKAIMREQPQVVVFGHTHRQHLSTIGNMLFVNPGYAGAPRASASRSVALIEWSATQEIVCTFKSLD